MDRDEREKTKLLIMKHEGFRGRMYKDSFGYMTIGYGHNLTSSHISQKAAEVILDDDLDILYEELPKHLSWYKGLDPVRRSILTDMAFNLGVYGLLKFRNFLSAMADGKWEQAAEHMLDSLWARQVPNRARENAESIRTGVINQKKPT